MTINSNGWNYNDAAQFSFDLPNTLSQNKIALDVIHEEDYAYENLYVSVHVEQPNGNTVKEIISIPLVSNEGKWLGSAFSGKRNKRTIILNHQLFQEEGTYNITINQNSRESDLNGINEIQFHILSQ